jgi:hypothetical protein
MKSLVLVSFLLVHVSQVFAFLLLKISDNNTLSIYLRNDLTSMSVLEEWLKQQKLEVSNLGFSQITSEELKRFPLEFFKKMASIKQLQEILRSSSLPQRFESDRLLQEIISTIRERLKVQVTTPVPKLVKKAILLQLQAAVPPLNPPRPDYGNTPTRNGKFESPKPPGRKVKAPRTVVDLKNEAAGFSRSSTRDYTFMPTPKKNTSVSRPPYYFVPEESGTGPDSASSTAIEECVTIPSRPSSPAIDIPGPRNPEVYLENWKPNFSQPGRQKTRPKAREGSHRSFVPADSTDLWSEKFYEGHLAFPMCDDLRFPVSDKLSSPMSDELETGLRPDDNEARYRASVDCDDVKLNGT